MGHPFKKIAISLLFTVAAVIFTGGCNQKTEKTQTEMTPVEFFKKNKKSVRLAGVMSAEEGVVPESALQVLYRAIREDLAEEGLKGGEPNLTIEVFVSSFPESGTGQAELKVYFEATEAMMAEAPLDFSSPGELADKVTDYLKKM